MTQAIADPTAEQISALTSRLEALERQSRAKDNHLSMVVFSGDLDKLLAAFMVATGAAACGMKVSMFFTFWASAALKKQGSQSPGKSWVEWMFGWMLPGGFHNQKLSKMDMGGVGRWLMRREMGHKNVAHLGELVESADELGVDLHVCELSMSLMGIKPEELIDYSDVKFCGVAHFLERARASTTTLFI